MDCPRTPLQRTDASSKDFPGAPKKRKISSETDLQSTWIGASSHDLMNASPEAGCAPSATDTSTDSQEEVAKDGTGNAASGERVQ